MNQVKKHFDRVAEKYDFYKKKNAFYYDNLKKLLKTLIPEGSRVLEFGCGTGDLLASLYPEVGYGFDLSSEMIKIAKAKYSNRKNLRFSTNLSIIPNQKSTIFDYIFMSDVIEHLGNPRAEFNKLAKLMSPKTKLIVTMANPIWEPFLLIAEKLGLKMPEGPHKRVAFDDLRIMIEDLGMKITEHDYYLLVPVKIPFVTDFANKYLIKILKPLAFIEYFVIIK